MSYKITIPADYPKEVSGSWPSGAATCLTKFVISGVTITTSDGGEHAVPVSEFRMAPEGSTLEETDCHFVDTGSAEGNLAELEKQIKTLAATYEAGVVTGMEKTAEQLDSQDEILTSYGYDKGETVELPSGSEITIDS